MVSSTPRPYFTPPERPGARYRRLGGPQGRSGRAENLVPPGFDPRTVQSVVSRYTEYQQFTRPYYQTAVISTAAFNRTISIKYCLLPKRMQLTLTAWTESLNSRDDGRGKTYRSCQKHWPIRPHDVFLNKYRSPFVRCFVCNKSKAKCMHISKHTEHYWT